ncbi:MAG: hypothetical protein H0V51_16985 [Chloroflexi bacterium]|nr:hypothetical protein [Chloroflexota bacterium]
MRELDYLTAPVVLALVLGPLMETAFRQSLIISQSSFADVLTRPICAVLLLRPPAARARSPKPPAPRVDAVYTEWMEGSDCRVCLGVDPKGG